MHALLPFSPVGDLRPRGSNPLLRSSGKSGRSRSKARASGRSGHGRGSGGADPAAAAGVQQQKWMTARDKLSSRLGVIQRMLTQSRPDAPASPAAPAEMSGVSVRDLDQYRQQLALDVRRHVDRDPVASGRPAGRRFRRGSQDPEKMQPHPSRGVFMAMLEDSAAPSGWDRSLRRPDPYAVATAAGIVEPSARRRSKSPRKRGGRPWK